LTINKEAIDNISQKKLQRHAFSLVESLSIESC
jgi:hypothetical protein